MSTGSSLADLVLPHYSWYCVGSLPFTDPQQAVSFILNRPQILPFWPELPQRCVEEAILPKSVRSFDSGWQGYSVQEAAGIYCLRQRLEDQKRRLSIVKCQLVGPLTALLYGKRGSDINGALLEEACRVCIKQIDWQGDFLSGIADRCLFVIDEPALCHCPMLTPAQRKLVKEAFSHLSAAVHERKNFFGLHSCDCFEPDMLRLPLDLLSFDALAHGPASICGETSFALWREALQNGLLVVPGVFSSVVTRNLDDARQKGLQLHSEFRSAFSRFGFSEYKMLLSASCGHAGAGLDWVEELYR